mmetsp:Transcript_120123/g.384794  ORF Transcript_120123/g.384794 Transcript_120123/m.384794 type:complete len:811 (-) Transcript_120123:511-2943(-)
MPAAAPSRRVRSLSFWGLVVAFATSAPAQGFLQWSGDLQNLSFADLDADEVQQLSADLVADIVRALGINASDVLDLDGRLGRVSLLSPSADVFAHDIARAAATTTTTTTTASTTTSTLAMLGDSAVETSAVLSPLRGMTYSALPCTSRECGDHGLPSQNLEQDGYAAQWKETGRDDLGLIAGLGANAVRLYHSLGSGSIHHQGAFLDRATALGLKVMPGFNTDLAFQSGNCPGFDCFDTWRTATLEGFKHGFRRGDDWHPAVVLLVLFNEPDHFENLPSCMPKGAWCRVKAVLSALDGVLAAEREAGVAPGRVKLAVTWSFAIRTSLDGEVEGPAIFGFQDMQVAIMEPHLAGYTPRTEIRAFQDAFYSRWAHGLNTQAPWSFVRDVVARDYGRFSPLPWFLGEYGANSLEASVIQQDLESMQSLASQQEDFLGVVFHEYQTAYEKGGTERNFGVFGLGEEVLGYTEEVCDTEAPSCTTWPVRCLSTDLSWLQLAQADRAPAVATAWQGSVNADHPSMCGNFAARATFTTSSTKTTTTMSNDRADAGDDRSALNASELKTSLPQDALLNGTTATLAFDMNDTEDDNSRSESTSTTSAPPQGSRMLLASSSSGTRLACKFRDGDGLSQTDIARKLGSEEFGAQLVEHIIFVLGNSSPAVQGSLGLNNAKVVEVSLGGGDGSRGGSVEDVPWWVWLIIGIGLALLFSGKFIAKCLARTFRKRRKQQPVYDDDHDYHWECDDNGGEDLDKNMPAEGGITTNNDEPAEVIIEIAAQAEVYCDFRQIVDVAGESHDGVAKSALAGIQVDDIVFEI